MLGDVCFRETPGIEVDNILTNLNVGGQEARPERERESEPTLTPRKDSVCSGPTLSPGASDSLAEHQLGEKCCCCD